MKQEDGKTLKQIMNHHLKWFSRAKSQSYESNRTTSIANLRWQHSRSGTNANNSITIPNSSSSRTV